MASRERSSQVRKHPLRELVVGEGGMLTVIQLASVTFCAITALVMLTVVSRLQEKLTLQNAADASANAAAVWLARGMNALCATNHLIGESAAMLVVHAAIAKPDPESGENFKEDVKSVEGDLGRAVEQLVGTSPPVHLSAEEAAAWRSLAASASPFAYNAMQKSPTAAATIGKAKLVLKRELAQLYVDKAQQLRAENWAQNSDEIAALNVREHAIADEDRVLNELLRCATDEQVIKAERQLIGEVLPTLRTTAQEIVRRTPVQAQLAASALGQANGAEIELFPSLPPLPVELDPLATAHDLSVIPARWYGSRKPTTYFERPADVPEVAISRRQIVKVTQLCRATFPWVNYHREPIFRYLAARCPISQADQIYFAETTRRTITICDELQTKQELGLYVPRQTTLPDKGFENWTDDPAEAETMFTVVAIARPEAATVASWQAERSATALAPSATARAITYNANPQHPHEHRIDLHTKRIIPIRQPATGWDTLQWSPNSDGDMPFELIGKGTLLEPEFPRVRPNWQAKCVPLLVDSVGKGDAAFRPDGARQAPVELTFVRQFPELVTH